MNIDNKPGRRRCKNHKAPLLAGIKITRGEGLQGSFAHLEIERTNRVQTGEQGQRSVLTRDK